MPAVTLWEVYFCSLMTKKFTCVGAHFLFFFCKYSVELAQNYCERQNEKPVTVMQTQAIVLLAAAIAGESRNALHILRAQLPTL